MVGNGLFVCPAASPARMCLFCWAAGGAATHPEVTGGSQGSAPGPGGAAEVQPPPLLSAVVVFPPPSLGLHPSRQMGSSSEDLDTGSSSPGGQRRPAGVQLLPSWLSAETSRWAEKKKTPPPKSPAATRNKESRPPPILTHIDTSRNPNQQMTQLIKRLISNNRRTDRVVNS